jgi:hypothetical protein
MTDAKDKSQEHLVYIAKKFPVGVYRHYKGNDYILFAHSINENTLIPLVHYYSIAKKTRWTRDFGNFSQMVKSEAEFGDREGPRFRFVRKADSQELLEACGIF